MQDEALGAAGLQEDKAQRPEGPGWRVWTGSLEAVFQEKGMRDPYIPIGTLGFWKEGPRFLGPRLRRQADSVLTSCAS